MPNPPDAFVFSPSDFPLLSPALYFFNGFTYASSIQWAPSALLYPFTQGRQTFPSTEHFVIHIRGMAIWYVYSYQNPERIVGPPILFFRGPHNQKPPQFLYSLLTAAPKVRRLSTSESNATESFPREKMGRHVCVRWEGWALLSSGLSLIRCILHLLNSWTRIGER